MKSMTGYGRGECARRGLKITVEVSSVNRKQSEIAVNLPRELEVLEARIRDEVNRRVSRGRVTVRTAVHAAGELEGRTRVDLALAKSYVNEFRRLAKSLKLKDEITLDMVVRSPGVIQAAGEISESEELWPAMQQALKAALDVMLRMREREGAWLAKDLKRRVAQMRGGVVRIQRLAPQVVARYREQLLERMRQSQVPLPGGEEERFLKELFYFADRCDISEELTRLQSHFQQFDDCVKSSDAIGRTLDFLAQEINREINTLGAKANDSLISREVVCLKAELEKFREQVQNVE